ncbi:hypothetical protein [Burkholderia gladioli]|uniref:hypothetical protein n=1 Tax=Burkholderia gladioli TaxID=28095 RepID=UPI001C25DBE5|nr:hypothetical protein [Burkholderia gladioli]MBU9384384.1 hypothetical protein [Burkholderia gladioli]
MTFHPGLRFLLRNTRHKGVPQLRGLASGQEAVKDRYREKYRQKSKISRRGERKKNAASESALQHSELENQSFVRIANDQNFGASFGGL